MTHFICAGDAKICIVDLGVKRLLVAERAEQKIAVEVKSFVSESEMQAF